MHRWDIVNFLIRSNDYKSYLEIGVREGDSFKRVDCDKKVGVDPTPGRYITYTMTSDEFFLYRNQEKYDIIFIDGLHESGQVHRDIDNALNCLSEGGSIVCHDMNPTDEDMQIIPRGDRKIWTGDSWKAWVMLRQNRDDLTMRVVDTDHGCGVIQRGDQKLLDVDEKLTYKNLEANRKEWLNLISVDEFLKIYS